MFFSILEIAFFDNYFQKCYNIFNMNYQPKIPLAEKMRPQKLSEVIGQKHLIGENGILRKIEYRESRNSYGEHPPYIFLDGVQIDANKYDNCELEFKNSISIVGTNWPGNGNLGCFFVIQTEK